jgi:hypothetical protein
MVIEALMSKGAKEWCAKTAGAANRIDSAATAVAVFLIVVFIVQDSPSGVAE